MREEVESSLECGIQRRGQVKNITGPKMRNAIDDSSPCLAAPIQVQGYSQSTNRRAP